MSLARALPRLASVFIAAILLVTCSPGYQTRTSTTHMPQEHSAVHSSVSPYSASETNPIILENRKPGTTSWLIGRQGYRVADDVRQQIKGYASATSVDVGHSINLYVTVHPVQRYIMRFYRTGWYGGKGGRLIRTVGPLQGIEQRTCPLNPYSGLIVCNWHASYTLRVSQSWTSGVYLVVLTNAYRYQDYIVFVVRNDASHAPILYQQPVTTYEAYNDYPDNGKTGKSLYSVNLGVPDSYGPRTVTGTRRAVEVSFDRPYADDGSGQFLWVEVNFIRWLERRGYDVTYSTDVDTDLRPRLLLHHKAFISVGHDEYWSMSMRKAVVSARDKGVNLAFFGANDIYRQFRFAPSSVQRRSRQDHGGLQERAARSGIRAHYYRRLAYLPREYARAAPDWRAV